MITLFYSPHMTSVDNEAGRASGHADVPLSAAGVEQALALGRAYADEAITVVFCSDLQRATTTAKLAFGERGIPIRPDARLRECNFGAMTQCPPAQLDEARHITDPYPQGESWSMAAQRVGACLRDLFPAYDGATVAVIGHKATKYGLEYWCGDETLAEIMRRAWERREIPIWRYELHTQALERAQP